ncbi:hypothetical protein FIV42_06550 [Persicimonas caeni]|uniref:DoxX family protein n=1 Tax=Persicimonas caeni TaxID=2292766 RepID=A0A4Y6PQ07_PERCE|nr:hypothetical protein [Persicimonas caeni]QDG50404.1 hypothetical protein FIV42_06550 [Persicimonas caeni]QED31625.1 hypothetical protein FRD00_06545 [Persicimonas caeni]
MSATSSTRHVHFDGHSQSATEAPPWSLYTLMTLVAFQAISGIAGGLGLMLNPTGAPLGIPQAWLAGSPFADYMVPGVILFAVLGVFPTVVAVALYYRVKWAFLATLAVGLGLTIWIGVEIAIIGYHVEPPLQAIYGMLGILITALALNPKIREHLVR